MSEGPRNVTGRRRRAGASAAASRRQPTPVEAIKADATPVSPPSRSPTSVPFPPGDAEIGEDRPGRGRRGQDGAISVEDSRRSAWTWKSWKACSMSAATPARKHGKPAMRRCSLTVRSVHPADQIQKISNIQDMVLAAGADHEALGRPLFIVAEDVEGEALATILLKISCVVRSPPRPSIPLARDRCKRILEDIAAVTGAQVIDKDFATLADARSRCWAPPRLVKVTKDTALIVDGAVTSPLSRTASFRSRTSSSASTPTSTARSCRSCLAKPSGGAAAPSRRSLPGGRAEGEEVPHRGRLQATRCC